MSALILSARFVQAQSSTETLRESGQQALPARELTTQEAAEPGSDEADQLITNRAMRAQTGSLSKWSLKSTWNYNGGSVESPLAAVRPNILQSATNGAQLALLSGQAGLKYRASLDNAVLLQVGLSSYAPFNSSAGTNNPQMVSSFNNQHGNVEIYDPTLSYLHLFKVAGIQNYFEVDANPATRNSLVAVGYVAMTTAYDTAMYEIGTSGLSVGGTVQVSYNVVQANGGALVSASAPSAGNQGQNEDTYDWQLFPTIEYILNDHFNLRTLTMFQYQHIREMTGFFNFRRSRVVQSFGFGIMITRDIFLYPNVQFIPDDLRAQETNVGLQANINIF